MKETYSEIRSVNPLEFLVNQKLVVTARLFKLKDQQRTMSVH
ncbi:MAG TPA: hypothetical protein VIT91_10745 [Chthoniobacterales bacterium]